MKINNLSALLSSKNMIEGFNQYRVVIAGVILSFMNLFLGISLIPFVDLSVIPFGAIIIISPFTFAVINGFSSWLAWKAKASLGFTLILVGLCIELLSFSLSTRGYGLIFALAALVFSSILVFEIIENERFNRILLAVSLFSPILYLLDYYGPQNRIVVSDFLTAISSYLVVVALLLFCLSFARNLSSINIVAKIAIPLIFFTYLMAVGITLFTESRLGILPPELISPTNIPLDEAFLPNTSRLGSWESGTSLILVSILMVFTLVISLITGITFTPVIRVAEQARKVRAGNMNIRAKIYSQDEIGLIADALNTLAFQLRQISETLELRVADRTRNLTTQLDSANQNIYSLKHFLNISRTLAMVDEIEPLLQFTVNTISKDLGYAHVCLFLIDAQYDTLYIRAASSAEGINLKDQGYQILLDQDNLICDVFRKGKPRYVENMGFEASPIKSLWFHGARSEFCLPLMDNGTTIGVLDMQSIGTNIFTEEKLQEYLVLGELIASLINKAQQRREAFSVIDDLQSHQQELLQQDWEQFITRSTDMGYVYMSGIVNTLNKDRKKRDAIDWQSLLTQGILVREQKDIDNPTKVSVQGDLGTNAGSTLTVPVMLRGEVIAAIKLQARDPSRIWVDKEIALAQSVADQVSLALENARLLEETRLRAEREVTVTKITGHLRSSNDPKVIMQTAIDELQKTLQVKTVRIILSEENGELDNRSNDGSEQNGM